MSWFEDNGFAGSSAKTVDTGGGDSSDSNATGGNTPGVVAPDAPPPDAGGGGTPPPAPPDYSKQWLDPQFPQGAATPQSITAAYQQFLGRPPTVDEQNSWLRNGGQGGAYQSQWQQNIYNSQEAQNYRKNTQPNAQGTGPAPAASGSGSSWDPSQYYGKTDSSSINAYVTGALAGTGREGDAAMWEQYITSKGGGANSYWDNLISKNQGGDAAGNGAGPAGSFQYPKWTDTFTYAPWTQQFTAPTGITEQNDPGYQARLQLADQGIQTSAAAQGTAYSGGTLKDIANYNQTFASQEYGNVYNRALTDYNTALQGYQQNYNTAAQQYNQKYSQYLNGYNQAYQSYMGNFGVSNTLNQNQWANYLGLAGIGANAAAGTNSAAGAYGAGASQGYYNYGNAGAAGGVGAANAYQPALGYLGNLMQYPGFLGTNSSYNFGGPGQVPAYGSQGGPNSASYY
jgi:hypothetical protein